MRPYLHFSAYVAALVTLVACAQLGLSSAKTFDQKLAYAYGTHTAVLQSAAAAVNAKTLSPTDGEEVLKLADESRALLDAAKAAGDTATGGSKLALATTILTQLQTYLNARGVK